jgi:FkbM family methyltransferase
VLGVRGLLSGIKGKVTKRPTLLKIERPDMKAPFYIRTPSSDVFIFEQILMKREYDFNVTRPPGTIIDAGANIGLASLYFANKFPAAKIIAIEPEESNFALLKMNTAPYENIVALHGALWHENRRLNLIDPDQGKWGFMTQATGDAEKRLGDVLHEVRGMTVDAIMKEQGLAHVDVLKIDIEGAEQEVFSDTSSWLGKVDTLIVELHERLKSGCARSFYNGSNGFDDEWQQGELVYLTRSGGCLTRAAPGPGPHSL